MVHNLRIRLPHQHEHQYGNCSYSHNIVAQGNNLSFGKEKLHEFSQNESIEAETRRSYKTIQQTGRPDAEATGNDG